MQSITKKIQRFLLGEDGPTAVEYAIILGMILIVVFAMIYLFGSKTSDSFSNSSASVSAAVSGS